MIKKAVFEGWACSSEVEIDDMGFVYYLSDAPPTLYLGEKSLLWSGPPDGAETIEASELFQMMRQGFAYRITIEEIGGPAHGQ